MQDYYSPTFEFTQEKIWFFKKKFNRGEKSAFSIAQGCF
jgi:hypothetical protein